MLAGTCVGAGDGAGADAGDSAGAGSGPAGRAGAGKKLLAFRQRALQPLLVCCAICLRGTCRNPSVVLCYNTYVLRLRSSGDRAPLS